MGRSQDDSVEPLGAERGIITKVEVDVTLERAIGVERGPAATAHVVALVGALPRELDARPAITIRVHHMMRWRLLAAKPGTGCGPERPRIPGQG